MNSALLKKSASFFKVVGDETRIKILYTISNGELCVNEISEKVNMTKSAVSHQLKLLKDESLVKSRRDGKNIYYSLDDQHVVDMLNIAFKHIEHKLRHEEYCPDCTNHDCTVCSEDILKNFKINL